MALMVVDPGGPLTTVQDLGRLGMERFGVPVSGAMDWFALQAANRLVGNPPGAAVLEFAFQGPRLAADLDCLVCVSGGGFHPRVGKHDLRGWTAVFVHAGEEISVVDDGSGTWGYLSVSGGLAVESVLGSASTYLRGGFGGLEGRALRTGDWLFSREERPGRPVLAGSRLANGLSPKYAQEIEARVIPGPQNEWFGEAGMQVFTTSLYQLSPNSDRMGYRLEGEPIPRRKGDLLSEGMVFGSIQVPPDGQPIVMMADRPATGGYPKIATVIRADLPKLAQLRPGEGRVRFRLVSVVEAQAANRLMIEGLSIAMDSDEFWVDYMNDRLIIDLNCDMGESFGRYPLGADAEVLQWVTSANIACGMHAGDPLVMQETVRLAVERGAAIGAHPGYPDLQGFGRRVMDLTPEEVEAFVLYQIGALAGFARAAGVELAHVKPHGALYNQAARDIALAEAIAHATARFSRELILVGLAGSRLIGAGITAGLRVAMEGFPDRAYNADGSLKSRREPGAVLTSVEDVCAQALRLVKHGVGEGASHSRVETLCIHGDGAHAPEFARAVRQALEGEGVRIAQLSSSI